MGGQLIDEPYVLASQASQVFYVENVRHKDWAVVVKMMGQKRINPL